MYSVFISYSHVDGGVANEICSILDSIGISYFRDVKNIGWGDGISDQVRSALIDSQSVLAIISPASLKSVWVPFEVGYCSALNRKVLPYLTHPAIDLPGYIGGVKFLSSLEDVSAYFSRPVREIGLPSSMTQERVPDVRVTYSAALARKLDGSFHSIVVFSIANHDSKAVYLNSLSLVSSSGVRMQITHDPLTGRPYERKMLNPGERMDVRIDRGAFEPSQPFAPNGIDPTSITDVVAIDDIGREFHGDTTRLVPVLLELFPERGKV